MRPRVLFVDHVAQLSGGEIALARLIEAAGGRLDVHVILAEDGPLVGRLRAAGAQVVVLPMEAALRSVRKDTVRPGGLGLRDMAGIARYVWRLRREIRTVDPDLVHTNSLKSALYGGLAGRLAVTRVVWHVRDRIESDYLPRPAVWLVRRMAGAVPHAIIANSNATLATIPTKRPSNVVYSAVVFDTLTIDGLRRPRDEGDAFRIGVVGRLAHWKGQHVFLEAFARAFPGGSEQAALIGSAMFGEDAYAASLHQQAERLGIAERVDFRGFREDVWAELARLDVLVHCSVTPEPFGQVVVEGMAAGVPVIAANAGGPAEIVTDLHDGLLVAPGDVDALVKAMRRLREDEDLTALLVFQAKRTIERFSPERTVAALLEVYDAVLSKKRGRGLR